eukprot:14188111-Ditylum_brightwellii.AAC.1
MVLFSLSYILSCTKTGFKINKSLVSHLLYINDLKIYAKNNEELERLNALVKAFSKEIGMTYSLDKCAVLTVGKEKPITSDILPEIPKVDETNGYKYLGVAEGCVFLTQEVKKLASKAYITWIHKILTSGLTRNKMMAAICAFAISLSFGESTGRVRFQFGLLVVKMWARSYIEEAS